MNIPIISPPDRDWVCPNCDLYDRTRWDMPNRFHQCSGLAGITAPMVPAGSGSRTRALVREDYVGNEIVQYDMYGRPIMAVVTDRPDGSNDVTVLAPTARMFVRD